MKVICVDTVLSITMIIFQHISNIHCTGGEDDFIAPLTPSRKKSHESFPDSKFSHTADVNQSPWKGKGILTHESSHHGEGTSAAPTSIECGTEEKKKFRKTSSYCRWTNEIKDHVLYLYYDDRTGGASKWRDIQNFIEDKSGYLLSQAHIRQHILQLVNKMVYDEVRPKGKIRNDPKIDYLRIYYQTRDGDESEHGNRMLQQWFREHPGHEGAPVPDMKAYVEQMIQKIMKLSPEEGDEAIANVNKVRMVDWKPEHDRYLHELMMNLPKGADKGQMIHRKMCERFPNFESLSVQRLYRRAVHIAHRVKKQSEFRRADSYKPSHLQHQEKRKEPISFFQFLDDQSNPMGTRQNNHHDLGGVENSSPYTGGHSDELDLSLGLNTLNFQESRVEHLGDN